MAGGTFGGGTGVSGDPYLIEDAADLNAVRNNLSAHYKLVADIDLNVSPYNTSNGWSPIGTTFTGVLDGDNYTISGMYQYEAPFANYIGFFNHIGAASIVKNLKFTNATLITTANRSFIGLLAGRTLGTVENVTIQGTLRFSLGNTMGGMMGAAQGGFIRNCEVDIVLERNANATSTTVVSNFGGLAGTVSSSVTIENTIVKGTVNMPYGSNVGGFIGNIGRSTINMCSSSASVYGHSSVGGFVGVIGAASGDVTNVKNCYATGRVEIVGTAYQARIGGFAGQSTNAQSTAKVYIENCFSTGDVYTHSDYVGGFSGALRDTFTKNCYTTSKLFGSRTVQNQVGGFAGGYQNVTANLNLLENCYSASVLNSNLANSTSSDVGAFIGFIYSSTILPMPNKCYYDSSIAGKATAVGGSIAHGGGVVGQTTAELQIASPDADTYIGWDTQTTDGTPEGTKIWIFSAGQYPTVYYNTVKKYLIQDGTDIKSWDGTAWVVAGVAPATDAMFSSHGMSEKTFYLLTSQFQSLVSDTVDVLCQSSIVLPSLPTLSIRNLPAPQLILPLGDINLSGASNIDSFTLTDVTVGTGIVKAIVSVDAGATWKAWDGTSWITVDTGLLSDVKAKGMTSAVLNALTTQWNTLRGASDTIRFGYYLEMGMIDDTAGTDEMKMQVDMTGEFRMARPGTDYDFSYVSNDKLRVRFYSNGDYKVNYVD